MDAGLVVFEQRRNVDCAHSIKLTRTPGPVKHCITMKSAGSAVTLLICNSQDGLEDMLTEW